MIEQVINDYLENPKRGQPVIVYKLLKSWFSITQIEMIADAISSTCNDCWDTDLNEAPCYCTRDD